MGDIISIRGGQRLQTVEAIKPDRAGRRTRMRQHLEQIVDQLSRDGVIRPTDLTRLAENLGATGCDDEDALFSRGRGKIFRCH